MINMKFSRDYFASGEFFEYVEIVKLHEGLGKIAEPLDNRYHI